MITSEKSKLEGLRVTDNFQLLDYLTKTAVKREQIVTSPLKSAYAKHPLVLLIGEHGNDRGNERRLGSVLPETVVRRRWRPMGQWHGMARRESCICFSEQEH
ncbi:hypothetical protein D8674_011331 [Pyrus ussuriensis x Pyrus communis]|uniref:Uncharacterized protein n=1 Tax=Pyrus ussuriensis x Pyrus communis TaxID=2448454 RepID=A0A5N5FYH9_9ROSA|nr:hypothetical protein D8674_011331 [Pyrus ussuriensis x Pyrus communis]